MKYVYSFTGFFVGLVDSSDSIAFSHIPKECFTGTGKKYDCFSPIEAILTDMGIQSMFTHSKLQNTEFI